MSLISTRCLFVLVLILLQFHTRSDGIDGFPKLDDKDKLKAALLTIAREDFLGFSLPDTFDVSGVLRCYEKNETYFAAELVKNEVRVRNGYKLLGEECSADPALNLHLFSPPSIRDLVAYPIWQRHLLDSNQPLCSPFKHLQCSKTTTKCECRPGLVWREQSFENHDIWERPGGGFTDVQPVRDRENICTFAFNKPCQRREYPGDEEIDSKSLRPEQIKEGIPLAEYFSIFHRFASGSDQSLGIAGLKIQPPTCGDNECSVSLYTQRQRVCAPRDWDKDLIFSRLEFHFSNRNQDVFRIPIGEAEFTCNYDNHRRLYTISEEELSGTDFWAKRKKNLEDLAKSRNSYCDLIRLSTCRPPKVGEEEGGCVCIHPFIQTNLTPSSISPNPNPASCVLPEEHNKCDMTNAIIKILRNETYARGTKLLLNEGVEKSMVGVCPKNFKCHTGLDIHDEMEIYCTCSNGKAGSQCMDELTGFLMFPRVPSFPSDGKDMQDKWKIFNEFNEKAIQFESIFKLSKGESCDLNAEAEASKVVERIRRLDKKGTVMTKAQYRELTDDIVNLKKQHQNGPGLCQRFASGALTCNSVNRTCVTEDEKIMLEACKHLADTCELEGMVVVSGKCFCAPKLEPSTTQKPPNNSAKSLRVVKPAPDYLIIVGFIIIAME